MSIVANYIKERTKNAQFVIISLRNNMFELADRLVGIYKTHDATKSVTINPKMFENALPAAANANAGAGDAAVETAVAKVGAPASATGVPRVAAAPLSDATNLHTGTAIARVA